LPAGDRAPGAGRAGPAQRLRRAVQDGFFAVEGLFDRAFGPSLNPLSQLGAMSFFLYWIVAATGIYLYIVFETSVTGAYESVEGLTEQWYLGGVMRSLHRYASDAMVVTVLVHLTREFVFDRLRGARWFSWFTGVPILWLLFSAGIGGYWLVWDQLAQYVAIVTSEWFDWLPIFGEPIARNFLTTGSLSNRFFTLLVFLHIGVPLFLLFAMWIHLLRLTRPKVNPPRALAAGTLVMLLALSFVKPAVSQGPADLATVAAVVDLDWFYLGLYPLIDQWSPGAVWALAAGVTALLAVLPWLPRRRPPSVAVVNLDLCNGCGRCFDDCPFEAVAMEARSDGRPYLREAVVDPNLCVSCGLCVGACPTATPFRKSEGLVTAIDLPHLPLTEVRRRMEAAMAKLSEAEAKREVTVVVFGCDHGPDVAACERPTVAACSLPCIAMLPPSFIDYILSRGGADGVMVAGCGEGACFHRFGDRWMTQRIAGERDPYLRRRVPRNRIAQFWAARNQTGALVHAVEAFREGLTAHAAKPPRRPARAVPGPGECEEATNHV
jgi:ferredoxin/coenzyme F420-reducing hydrogenase delta subunit